MELRKTITARKWLIIKLLVLSLYAVWVVIYFLWGIDYIYLGLIEKPTDEHEQLTQQIESSRKELAGMPDLVAEREYQLVRAQELLASEESKIPVALNINDLVRDVIKIADECQVKVVPLTTAPPQSIPFGQYSCSYWNIILSVKGDFQNIADFIEKVDGEDMPTATVTSAVLSQDEGDTGSENTTNYAPSVSGSLELVIYTRD